MAKIDGAILQSNKAVPSRAFVPSLEGVRGYAFLAVFFAHYFSNNTFDFDQWWLYPAKIVLQIAWVSVPVFFVLSGFLICGILIDTREKEGYFKIFYSRRILRVFPLYYLTLIVVGLVSACNGYPLNYHFWAHFLYIHNLVPGYVADGSKFPDHAISHLWSMGVEEQFYLLWPLMVWICPSRRILLRVTLALIAGSFTLRFAANWLNLEPWAIYFWTPTRVDAILVGAVFAIVRGEAIYRRLQAIAPYVALGGAGVMMLLAERSGNNPAVSSWTGAVQISVWNITAAGVVLAVMREGSWLCRLCSMKGICWIGARSYGLYLFHALYLYWFVHSVVAKINNFMPYSVAYAVSAAIAFALTVLLAGVCYRLIELPAMNLKKRLQYGGPKMQTGVNAPVEPVPVREGIVPWRLPVGETSRKKPSEVRVIENSREAGASWQ